MAPFEVVLAVYGLLLGFTLNEALSGFGRTMKTKRAGAAIRIGWLIPLLAVFVAIEVTGFWSIAYMFRDRVIGDHLTLLAVLAIVGTYYMAATHLFPLKPEEWPDLDEWYHRQKRMIFGCIISANLLGFAAQFILDYVRPVAEEPMLIDSEEMRAALAQLETLIMIENGITVSLLTLAIALMFIRSRPISTVLLSLLVALGIASAYVRSSFSLPDQSAAGPTEMLDSPTSEPSESPEPRSIS